MENVVPVQKCQSLQYFITYKLLVILILHNLRGIYDLSHFKVKVQNHIYIMMIGWILSSFCGFFVDDFMATCDIFVIDGMEHIDLSKYCKMSAFLVIHPFRLILLECKILGFGVLMTVEEVIEDVIFAFVDFSVQEHSTIPSFA